MQIELKRIQREVGITFIYVTHDQEEALTMSDRIAVMNDGRVEQIGTPQEIYHSPTSVFVANFIGVANLIPGVVRVQPGRTPPCMVAGPPRGAGPARGPDAAVGRRRHHHGPARAAAPRAAPADGGLGRPGDGRARGVPGPGHPLHARARGRHRDRRARRARAIAPGPPARPRPLGGLGHQRGAAAAPARRSPRVPRDHPRQHRRACTATHSQPRSYHPPQERP